MVLGCGLWGSVFPGLITLLPTAPGGTKTARVRTAPLRSSPVMFAIALIVPSFPFLISFLCKDSSRSLFFSSQPFYLSPHHSYAVFSPLSSSPQQPYKTHTLICVHTNTCSSSFDHQAGSALIWINWQRV